MSMAFRHASCLLQLSYQLSQVIALLSCELRQGTEQLPARRAADAGPLQVLWKREKQHLQLTLQPGDCGQCLWLHLAAAGLWQDVLQLLLHVEEDADELHLIPVLARLTEPGGWDTLSAARPCASGACITCSTCGVGGSHQVHHGLLPHLKPSLEVGGSHKACVQLHDVVHTATPLYQDGCMLECSSREQEALLVPAWNKAVGAGLKVPCKRCQQCCGQLKEVLANSLRVDKGDASQLALDVVGFWLKQPEQEVVVGLGDGPVAAPHGLAMGGHQALRALGALPQCLDCVAGVEHRSGGSDSTAGGWGALFAAH
mmetsp:Transcript_14065/g.30468  ORF Transcript_14065/g.30468 Transcript_14065/m.30468 type:complete len:314 (-) Transcript_14065:1788-2729(-)